MKGKSSPSSSQKAKEPPKSQERKKQERELRQKAVERGQAGLAGAGRGGPHETKKQRAERPDRKQKHKQEWRAAAHSDGSLPFGDIMNTKIAEKVALRYLEKVARRAVDPRNVKALLALRKGDMIQIDAHGLRKPRTLEVKERPERFPNTGSIAVMVSSGRTRPGRRSGGAITYTPERDLEGTILPEELIYQPTLMQSPMDVKAIKVVSKGSADQMVMGSED